MDVYLVDYTGAGKSDPAHYAANILMYAKNTRLTQGRKLEEQIEFLPPKQRAAELHSIAMSIPSSWEFVDYTFQILGVTRAFTHQFVRGRHASYAQQSQRVIDFSNFETLIPDRIKSADSGRKWNETMKVVSDAYAFYRECEIPAEDCRGMLPNNALTNIMAKMNLRVFVETFRKRSSPRVQGEYRQVISLMADRVIEVHPWAKDFLFPERLKTPATDALIAKTLDGRQSASVPEVNDAIKEIEQLKATWS